MSATSVTGETTDARVVTTARPGRRLLAGTIRIFAAEALLVPTGILTAAFLSRRFGPAGYGLLTLAGITVAWVEGNVAAALSRPVIKLVGEAEDWHPVASAALRLHLAAGVALALLLCALAGPLAAALGEEQPLANYLRLYALEIPVFCAAQAHRCVLIGLGRFRERALATATRWVSRLLLVVALVALTGSAAAAVCGSVLASVVELAFCRARVRVRLFGAGAYPARRLCVYAMPLVAAALSLSLFGRLDIILLKALGGSAAEAGVYGVAQNLALLPGLFTLAFAPALLSTLSRALRDGDERGARELAATAVRAPLLLLPFAAAAAGCAHELVPLIFGAQFLAAAPLLRLLTFGALAFVMISVTTSVLTAAGKPKWTFHAAWPLAAAAAALHLAVIPRAGSVGAATVTAGVAFAGAVASVVLVGRRWRVSPPAPTFARVLLVGAPAYAAAALVPAPGLWCVPKLACVCVLAAAALALLGEFGPRPLGAARSQLRRRQPGRRRAPEIPREAS